MKEASDRMATFKTPKATAFGQIKRLISLLLAFAIAISTVVFSGIDIIAA